MEEVMNWQTVVVVTADSSEIGMALRLSVLRGDDHLVCCTVCYYVAVLTSARDISV